MAHSLGLKIHKSQKKLEKCLKVQRLRNAIVKDAPYVRISTNILT
ncbi:hypothetical protein [Scytonema sp. NUACC21]